MHIDNVLL